MKTHNTHITVKNTVLLIILTITGLASANAEGWEVSLPYGAGGAVNPAVIAENWTGEGGYYSRYGWNYGPNAYPIPAGTTPVRYMAKAANGAAVYQSASGQIWYQQPY